MRKTIPQDFKSSSVQKTARKNIISRNETILNNGHLAKAIPHANAIPFAKWSVCVKN